MFDVLWLLYTRTANIEKGLGFVLRTILGAVALKGPLLICYCCCDYIAIIFTRRYFFRTTINDIDINSYFAWNLLQGNLMSRKHRILAEILSGWILNGFFSYALLNCQNHTNHQKVIESHFFSRFRPVGSTIFIHSVSVFQFARRDHSGGNTHIQHTNGVKK